MSNKSILVLIILCTVAFVSIYAWQSSNNKEELFVEKAHRERFEIVGKSFCGFPNSTEFQRYRNALGHYLTNSRIQDGTAIFIYLGDPDQTQDSIEIFGGILKTATTDLSRMDDHLTLKSYEALEVLRARIPDALYAKSPEEVSRAMMDFIKKEQLSKGNIQIDINFGRDSIWSEFSLNPTE